MLLLPHNHRMWASIGIYTGREDNITWKRQGAAIEASGAASLSEKEVFSLPDTAIHSVTNPIERLTGAFHVYGGDFFANGRSEWDAETLQERPFRSRGRTSCVREGDEAVRGSSLMPTGWPLQTGGDEEWQLTLGTLHCSGLLNGPHLHQPTPPLTRPHGHCVCSRRTPTLLGYVALYSWTGCRRTRDTQLLQFFFTLQPGLDHASIMTQERFSMEPL
jgi:hypothetical protein